MLKKTEFLGNDATVLDLYASLYKPLNYLFMKKMLFFCIGFFFVFSLTAQKPGQILGWINSVTVDAKNFYYEIPFEYKNDLIIIKVAVGAETYDYIFDTGGYTIITNEMQNKNSYKVLAVQNVGSSNQLKTKVNIVAVDSMAIGKLAFKNIGALQMDLNSPTLKCTVNGGVIGAAIIKNYIWQIDYSNRKLIVTDQLNKIKGLDKAVKLNVSFSNTLMPYLEAKVNGKKHKFMFDLGSVGKFSMTKKTAMKFTKNINVYEKEGSGSEGVNGVVNLPVSTFKADIITIGDLQFKDQPVLFTDVETEELIGNPIIKEYIITLNFKNKEMYLEPIAGNITKQGWETYGFSLGFKEGKVFVKTLDKTLSAAKSGLLLYDEVVAINGEKIEVGSECSFIELNKKILSGNEDLNISIIRNNLKRDILITKQKVF